MTIPSNDERRPPVMPRRGRGGVPEKRAISHVKKVVVVSSGKGGVGKSTVSVNLALALLATSEKHNPNGKGRKARVGLLDLDIFGPSVPKLMGLEGIGEPELTQAGALLPLRNHGISCMSMGFLLPPSSSSGSNADTVVAWRGMMVMKAVQQLLFDVDWRRGSNSTTTTITSKIDASSTAKAKDQPPQGGAGDELDVLVIDMPPGTGDVALSLGQLVKVDGAVIVSTPQEVALIDARKGVSMFEKVQVPIVGMILNMYHFVQPEQPFKVYPLFGSSKAFDEYAESKGLEVLGRLPLEPWISQGGDRGLPVVLEEGAVAKGGTLDEYSGRGRRLAREEFLGISEKVWKSLV
ncbi:P-loop containing nucleoside triphosphate hydrolase protein [Violaceomyces palustris]|uniref:P-loop containing nucleoside triphosphate hydrolase protein n=1 Tax=Violaceomyces palustris TaxID=1673888 RepID=A0ACD0P473_9BASI|nr:P-loop containing nucleoside triphosphate hydrolase protein [Violaceomyces palustris]